MKRIFLSFTVILLCILTGCSLVKTKPEYYAPDVYAEVLCDYDVLLHFRFSEDFDEKHNNGESPKYSSVLTNSINRSDDTKYRWNNMLVEMDSLHRQNDPLHSFGYLFCDINNDGTDELLWTDYRYNILAIFTVTNGKAVLLDSFWSRYNGYINSNGQLYTQGSGGADNTVWQIKELSPNSAEFNTVKEFGTDGHSSHTYTTVYYEVINGAKTDITKERFDNLTKEFPFEPSESQLIHTQIYHLDGSFTEVKS